MTTPHNTAQPYVIPLDDGGEQVEWHCRQFDIEVVFNAAGACEGVLVHDLVSGYQLEWDAVEGRLEGSRGAE